jgi:hypothetical protein
MLILLALQAASPAAAPPERFSILAPAAASPCRETLPADSDIVVCSTPIDPHRLPLPAERGPPDRPMPSNPNLDGAGALAAGGRGYCASMQSGCTTGVDIMGAGTAAIRLVQKLVAPDSCCEAPGEATDPFRLVGDVIGGAKRAGKKTDKANRVAIDLSEPPPPPRATP